MHKIKYDFLMRLYAAKLSKAELNTVLYLCIHQDNQGSVTGVHYQDVIKEISYKDSKKKCPQTFYNVLRSLQEKGIISCVHNKEAGDYDVMLTGNDFSDGDYSCGYISLRKMFISRRCFKKLKANEVLLILKLLYLCQSNRGKFVIGREKFLQTYMDKLGVKKRAVERYLHMLRYYFTVRLENKKYIFVPKNFMQHNIKKSDETFYNEYIVKTMARRNRIRKMSEEEIAETAKLIHQYENIAGNSGMNIWEVFKDCLKNSLEWINQYKGIRERKEYSLRYKLIHKMIKESLQMV